MVPLDSAAPVVSSGRHRWGNLTAWQRAVRVSAVLVAVATLVELAAGLTTDVPQAAPIWRQWIAAAADAIHPDWLGPAVYWVVLAFSLGVLLYDALARRLGSENRIAVSLDALAARPPTTASSVQEVRNEAHATDAPASDAAAAALADQQALIVFRTYYSFLRRAVSTAVTFVQYGICSRPISGDGSLETAQLAVAELTKEIYLPLIRTALSEVGKQLRFTSEPSTEDEFQAIQWSVRGLTRQYIALLRSVKPMGELLLGPGSTALAPGYALLYKQHQRLADEARRHRERTDWGGVVAPSQIDHMLEPAHRDLDDSIEGMSARELQQHAMHGLSEEFVGRMWSAWITIGEVERNGGRLFVTGKVSSGVEVCAYMEEGDIGAGTASHVAAGIRLVVYGKIKDTGGRVVLSPAWVRAWPSPPHEAGAPSAETA